MSTTGALYSAHLQTEEHSKAGRSGTRVPGVNVADLRHGMRSVLGILLSFMLVASVLFVVVPPAGAVTTASLIQTIDTSLFDPASPDPSGVTYLPGSDHLLIVDSEVDETTGAGYNGVNIWELTRTGDVVATGTTVGYSNEPTGVTHDPSTNTVFISSDDESKIFLRQPGIDGKFGTGDDVVVGEIDTGALGVADTEDPEFITTGPLAGHLFFLNGQTAVDVYHVDPVNGIFGDGDDSVSHFNLGYLGITDTEALAFDPIRNSLLVGASNDNIYEITLAGGLIRTIDAGVPGLSKISGLTMAPASDGSGDLNYWIVDRQVDNDSVPTENDGKLFEISAPADGSNIPPAVDSVVVDQPSPGTVDTLTVTVEASDPDGDSGALTFEYQWLANGADIVGATGDSLDLSVAGNGDKGDAISVRVTASDGVDTSAPLTSGDVTVANTPPVFDADLDDRTDAEGVGVDFSAGAGDLDGDPLVYSATGLPPGVGIDPASGQITGTIDAGAASGSPYMVEITVADDEPTTPITLVQKGAISGGQRDIWTASYPSQPTEGNLLIALGFTNSSTYTMSDGWQLAMALPGTTQPLSLAFYKVAGPAEPSLVSLSTGDVINGALSIFEYSGLNDVQAEVLDRVATNTVPSGSTSISTGTTVLTSEARELLIAAVNLGGYDIPSSIWTNGFTAQTTGAYATAWRTASCLQLVSTRPRRRGQPPPQRARCCSPSRDGLRRWRWIPSSGR